jgi:hypothetical protein
LSFTVYLPEKAYSPGSLFWVLCPLLFAGDANLTFVFPYINTVLKGVLFSLRHAFPRLGFLEVQKCHLRGIRNSDEAVAVSSGERSQPEIEIGTIDLPPGPGQSFTSQKMP